MVYSSSYYSQEVKFGSTNRLFLKQLLNAAIGFVIVGFATAFDYHKYTKIRLLLLIVAFGTLLAVFTPLGLSVNGSRRWLSLGFSIQPSEIMKAALILFISGQIGKYPRQIENLRGFVFYLALMVAACVPIILQPNFSAIICICGLVLIMMIVGGAKWRHILVTALLALCALAIIMIAEPYRISRITAMLDPFSGDSASKYQLRQSLYSIAAGGLFGRGLGNSMQKLMYLPFSESDFIFSIVVEELGLVGGVVVLLIFALLIYRGVLAAMRAPDLTGCLIATGVTSIISIQVIINVGVVCGVVPPTGVVLPFISYGGSNLIVFMGLVGILLNVSRYSVKSIKIRKV